MPERPQQIVVLLHDMSDSPLGWQDQVVALPPDWRPLTPWLRGMKPTDREDFDLQAAADALGVVPLEYGVDSFVICGVGLGATVALRCAADSPDMVRGLLLVTPLIAPPGPMLAMQRAALRMTPRSRLAARNVDKDRLLAAMDMLAGIDLDDAPEAVTCPSLIVSSSDQRGGAEQARQLAGRMQRARTVPLAGLPPQKADPQAFNTVLLDFLASLDEQGGEQADTRG